MKRNWSLWRAPRTAATVLVTAVLLACAVVVSAAEEGPDDSWRFTVTPYLWLAGIDGTMKLETPPGYEDGSVDTGEDNVLENLTSVFMIDMGVRKGRWSLLADFIYFEFSDEDQTARFPQPGGGEWTTQTDTSFQAVVFELAGAYTVFLNEYLNLDLLAGARRATIESEAALEITGPLPAWVSSKHISDTVTFVDPIIGLKGTFELGKGWIIPYYFDIGGFTVDSDLTLQAVGGIGYRFCDWVSMAIGYRYLYYDFGDSKLVEDLNMSGVTLAFNFTF